MPSTRNPSDTQTQTPGRSDQSQQGGRQWQGNQSQEQDDDLTTGRNDADPVEVGDPVPQDDRTIRADTSDLDAGSEDEDLADDDDDLLDDGDDLLDDDSDEDGSSSERH